LSYSTFVPRRRARNLCIAILNTTRKNALSFLLCLCLLFNKIEIRAEKVLPGHNGAVGMRVGVGGGGRNDPNNVSHVNK
jgi:hypothetical protein